MTRARQPSRSRVTVRRSGAALAVLAAAALAGLPAGNGMAQSQEAQSPNLPVPPPPPDPGSARVSTPEPAPNPVTDMQLPRDEAGAGIDPELGPIAEPDSGDIGPALRQEGGGSWEAPDEAVRRQAREALARAAAEAARAAAERNSGVMPKLVGPTIPIVPLALLFPPEIQAEGPRIVRETRGVQAVFTGVNRSTGESRRFTVPVGRQATFGSLQVNLEGCYKSAPEDQFEAWAYVNVVDRGRPPTVQLAILPQRERARQAAQAGPQTLRRGWIIASSPTVTPIDHPVYDLWLVACEGDAGGPMPVAQGPDGLPVAPPAATPAATTVPAETGGQAEARR
jgi:hypothetical protein